MSSRIILFTGKGGVGKTTTAAGTATLAAREAKVAVPAALVVLPTPPLPVKSTMRTVTRPTQASDSTRFFRPFSAVSMMTFSALRRSMPIIGIEMSTASR